MLFRSSYELLPVDAYVKGNVHPVEKFLFEARKGHCELFATAGALLLRASGIPARLVVGFRVRAPSRGNAITVKSSEAHSWVEYWSASKGWVPFDPTPPAKESLWMGEGFRDAYEVLQAYWHRDILEYEVDRDRLLGLAFKTLALIFVSFFAALAFKFIKKRKRSPNTRERLFRIREKFEESLLYRNGLLPNAVYEKSPEAGEWRECYKRLRFGRIPPTEGDLREMKGRARELLRILA